MKFDYKPKTTKTGSPLVKRALHLGLGFTVVVCLSLAIAMGKHSMNTKKQEVLELPSLAVTNTKPKTSNEKVENEDKDDKLADLGKGAKQKVEELNIPAQTLENSVNQENKTSLVVSQNEGPAIEGGDTAHAIKIRSGDTLAKIFKKIGVSTKDLQKIMSATSNQEDKKHLVALKPGKILQLAINKEQQLKSLKLDIAPGNTLTVLKSGENFKVEHIEKPLDKQVAFGKGAIQSSLFSSAKRAGLDHNVINQFVEIFGWNIDFALDLQPKDTFRVLYEDNRLEGERVKTGPILAAEIINEGKRHVAIRYTDKNGQTAYFSPEGYGMHQAFLRTPVTFTRISSNFGMRNHPILHKLRRHTGVDYSAPVGTPVKSTSDGKVTFVGRRGGYGNVIELQHGARYSTLYAHLSKFAKGLKCGQAVNQGQVIGFVGKTGLATGPHLHYEFRIDGIHRDPLTVALPRRNPLSNENKKQFLAHAEKMLRLMDQHENKVGVASAQGLFSTLLVDANESSQFE